MILDISASTFNATLSIVVSQSNHRKGGYSHRMLTISLRLSGDFGKEKCHDPESVPFDNIRAFVPLSRSPSTLEEKAVHCWLFQSFDEAMAEPAEVGAERTKDVSSIIEIT
jgi:hypothetical protein